MARDRLANQVRRTVMWTGVLRRTAAVLCNAVLELTTFPTLLLPHQLVLHYIASLTLTTLPSNPEHPVLTPYHHPLTPLLLSLSPNRVVKHTGTFSLFLNLPEKQADTSKSDQPIPQQTSYPPQRAQNPYAQQTAQPVYGQQQQQYGQQDGYANGAGAGGDFWNEVSSIPVGFVR